MTSEQAKQAFIDQVRVVHNCHCSRSLIVYKRICKYIWDIRADGKKVTECALTDDKERVIVFALPSDLAVYDDTLSLTRENYFD